MKHLKIFEDFEPGLPVKKIDEVEFKSLLNQNCQNFIKVMKEIDYNISGNSFRESFLFRKFGSDLGNFVFTKPKDSIYSRISPWTIYNYHNLLVSNLESWKGYPKRNKSLICAGYYRAYSHSGNSLYLVIPYDTTKIGVCPEKDFWDCFECWINKYQDLPVWTYGLIKLVAQENIDSSGKIPNLSDNNWGELVPYLDKKYEDGQYLFKNYLYNYDSNKTLLQNIDDYFNPESNGFKMSDFISLVPELKHKTLECWFEDEAIMVDYYHLLDLDRDQLISLFS